MNAEQLKKSLLQMAMQGKLVEQREKEPTVEQLGKAPDEVPFAIPEKWKWVKFSNVAKLLNDRAYKKSELLHQKEGNTPVIRVGNFFTNSKWYYSNLSLDVDKYCEKGDLLYAWSASFGPKIWNGEKSIYHYHIWKILLTEYVYRDWLYYWLLTKTQELKGSGRGLTMIHITKKGMEQELLALPPLAEQHRIVEKLEYLLPLVETYGKAQSELKAMETALPAQLKKSLLQMAIQGKLVEQREEEGHAQELLEKIQKEKQLLIQERKIKKEKPLPEITEDEKPFDIPENWVWARLRELVYNKGQKIPDTDFCYIDIGSIDNSSQKLDKENTVLTPDEAPSRARKIVSFGDILYSTVRPYLHNMCILDRDFPFPTIASTGFAAMTCLSGCFNRFLFYYLMSPDFDKYANSKNNAKGIAYPAINDEKLYRALIPLPPLAEQRRIVEKLESLLPLCDTLAGNYPAEKMRQ